MLLTDKTMETQIRGIVTNAQQATANVNHASAQADTLISDIESRHLPQRVDHIVDSVNDTTSQINQSAIKVHQSLTKALGPDSRGNEAAQNVNDALSNLSTATGNMSEDTEALKRNFFFRGFFRNRGYYNLTSISPEEYRRDRLFHCSPDPHVTPIPICQGNEARTGSFDNTTQQKRIRYDNHCTL